MSFLTDIVLSGRPQRMQKVQKVGYDLQGKRKEIGGFYEVSRNYHTMGQTKEGSNQTMLLSENRILSSTLLTMPTVICN